MAFIAVYLGWNGDSSANGFRYSPVLKCPLYETPAIATYASVAGEEGCTAYGYNYQGFSSNPTWPQIRRFKVVNSSQKILVADSGISALYPPAHAGIIHWQASASLPISDRHSGGSNILFADGHIELRTAEQVGWDTAAGYYKYWDPSQ